MHSSIPVVNIMLAITSHNLSATIATSPETVGTGRKDSNATNTIGLPMQQFKVQQVK